MMSAFAGSILTTLYLLLLMIPLRGSVLLLLFVADETATAAAVVAGVCGTGRVSLVVVGVIYS
jgi:hypothetical protein